MITSMLRRAQLTGGCLAKAKPNQVGGLTATASGQTTINLSWDADTTPSPDEAAEYDIERSNDGTTGWSVIATVAATATSFSDVTLSASTTRHYRIVAKNCFDVAMPSTSASATTASSTPTAAWTLDFSTGTPSGYTLTRASSGTYVDSSGYIASASTDVARLTHNSSGSRLGLLVQGQRTNLQTQSALAAATWPVDSATRVSTTETAPDNTSTATLLRDSSGVIYHFIVNDNGQPAVSASTVYTFSCYLKAGSSNYGALSMWFGSVRYTAVFELTGSGAVTSTSSNSSPTSPSSGIESVGNGWYRCRVTYTSPVGATNARLFVCISNSATPSYSANLPGWSFTNTTDVRMWGAQLEQAETVSSYIPTTTASVTRSADLVHVLDSSITSWGDPGALVVHFYPPGQAGTLISTDDAATAQVGIEANTTTDVRAFWSSGSTAAETMTTGVQKAVHYWNGSTSKLCLNGGPVRSGTNNLTIANTDFVTLGAEATESGGVPGTFSQYANCVIRKVEFYSGTLTDANLQTITT